MRIRTAFAALAGAVIISLSLACDKTPASSVSPTPVQATEHLTTSAPAPSGAVNDAASTPSAQLNNKKPDSNVCALSSGGFTLASTNPYFPLQVGRQWQYEGEEEGVFVQLQITVLDAVEVVGGVTTHVVEEQERHDGELVEVSRNFFAESENGTVCYFGEDVDIYEDGVVVSHEGSWRADAPGNAPGIIMPSDPRPGMKYLNENAPGVAEDQAMIVGTGPVKVPAGTFPDAIRVKEFNPLDGDRGVKVFARGIGLVIDGSVQLVSQTS